MFTLVRRYVSCHPASKQCLEASCHDFSSGVAHIHSSVVVGLS